MERVASFSAEQFDDLKKRLSKDVDNFRKSGDLSGPLPSPAPFQPSAGEEGDDDIWKDWDYNEDDGDQGMGGTFFFLSIYAHLHIGSCRYWYNGGQ